MATWKYGPIEIEDDGNGYGDPIKENFKVEYNTTADVLIIYRDDRPYVSFGREASRAIGKMIHEWYQGYILG